MEMQWNESECRYLRCHVHQVQNLEQTQELRLPDGMPDIGRILCAWGQGMIRSKEWRSDGMTVSGGVTAWVLYAPEDGSEPRSLELWLPFSGKWNFTDSRREGVMSVTCQLRSLDARTLSARKCMVRSTVCILAQAREMDEATVYTPPQLPEGMELLQSTYPAMLPVEAGEKLFQLEDAVALEVPPRKLLACDVQPVLLEQNAAGSRVVFRGTCRVHLVYMGEDDRLHGQHCDLPFAQLAELDRDYDKDAMATVMLAVSGLESEIQDNQAQIKCSLIGQYLIYERTLLQLTEDAYSPFQSVQPRVEQLQLPMLLEHTSQTVDWQQELPIPVSEVVDLTVRQEYPTQYREGDTVTMEIPYSVQALYYDGEGNLRSHTQNGSGRLSLPAGDGVELRADIFCGRQPAGLQLVDKLRVDGAVTVDLVSIARQAMPMLTGLELGQIQEPDPNRPSLILQRLGHHTLWSLAKACGSTVAAIQYANQLTQDPTEDRMLLIPVL